MKIFVIVRNIILAISLLALLFAELSTVAQAAALSVVEVDAFAVNCIFAADCTNSVSDLTDDITLPLSGGVGFLQSSTFPAGEAGTVAEGLYGYQYRIDVREVAGVPFLSLPCVSSLSLDFGVIVPLDYNGDSADDDIFVITSGGVGTIVPSSADLSGDSLTFQFSPPICAGSSVGRGETSFSFGLTSSLPPQNVEAQLTGTLSYSDTLNARAPQLPSRMLSLTADQSIVEPGDIITLMGTGYLPGGYSGTIQWDGGNVKTFEIPNGGTFSQPFMIPASANPGRHTLSVCALFPCATDDLEQRVDIQVEVALQRLYLPLIQSNTTSAPISIFSYTIDPAVIPADIVLPPLNGQPRPLAAITDRQGNVATFVANELVVQTNNSVLLERIVATYGGEILLQVNPTEAGIADLGNLYLVRVNLSTADLSQLTVDLQTLDGGGGENGKATGAHRISSDDGARLLAIASAEAIEGHSIGVNWVGLPTDVPFSSSEANNGPAGYSNNAYNWSYMNSGSVQDIGTVDAWNALYFGNRMGNKVKVAVLDGGFAANGDFPSDTSFLNIFPFDPRNVAGLDGRAPWHGTDVLQTVAARSSNRNGVVGIAPTIAQPIALYTSYDFFTSTGSVLLARVAGALAINMSYSANVPALLSWSVRPFELTTAAVRATGALLFASAGNSDKDVDGIHCAGNLCWEHTFHTPCENMGVLCVGGLETDSKNRAAGSNFGSRDGVHIFAPYRVFGGQAPNRLAGNTTASLISGTSFSSPFAASVAALIWAANPGLNASQVWDVMHTTAHTSPDPSVPRYVNAFDAVMQTIGLATSARIKAPLAGTYQQGLPLTFRAEIGYVAASSNPLIKVSWTSDRDGELDLQNHVRGLGVSGFDSVLSGLDLSVGTHTITVLVTAGDARAEDTVVITIVNSPPTAQITQPTTGTSVCLGEVVNFRSHAFDPNQPTGLPESAYVWSSSISGNLGTGALLTRSDLPTGTHNITLRVTDRGGLFVEATITLTVLADADARCADIAPTVQITSPADGSSFWADTDSGTGLYYKTVTFTGQISDREDSISELTVEWLSSIDGSLGAGTVNTSTGEVSLTVDLLAREECGTPYRITLRVVDTHGNSAEDLITVHIHLLC